MVLQLLYISMAAWKMPSVELGEVQIVVEVYDDATWLTKPYWQPVSKQKFWTHFWTAQNIIYWFPYSTLPQK